MRVVRRVLAVAIASAAAVAIVVVGPSPGYADLAMKCPDQGKGGGFQLPCD